MYTVVNVLLLYILAITPAGSNHHTNLKSRSCYEAQMSCKKKQEVECISTVYILFSLCVLKSHSFFTDICAFTVSEQANSDSVQDGAGRNKDSAGWGSQSSSGQHYES